MFRLPLAAWLALSSVVVVLLVVAALAPAALTRFERLAEDHARQRAELAAIGAREAIERQAEEVRTRAALLAERPTLARLVERGDRTNLTLFLEQFRATGDLDGCAVVQGGVVLAEVPPAAPWLAAARQSAAGPSFFENPSESAVAWIASQIEVSSTLNTTVVAVRRLDAARLALVAEQVGLAVAISRSGRDKASGTSGSHTAHVPLDSSGRWSVETSLPAEQVSTLVAPLRRSFVTVALVATVGAISIGVLVARRLVRPLEQLGLAAERIGSGDLTTPVVAGAGIEATALAGAMESMRVRLRGLTTELRHREAESQEILTGISDGVFVVDADRRIRYLNPRAAELLAVAGEQAVGQFCGDVLHASRPRGQRPCDEHCPIVHARSRGRSRAVEHLELPAGRRTVVVTSAPPTGPGQVQVLRDETEIEGARRSRDAVLANVSHELKTPLSAQLASIELLREGLDTLEPAQAGELVSALERSTLRLSRLVDNLLESVRIETGQATLRRVPVDLGAVLEDAIAMTQPLFAQRRQRVDWRPDPDLGSSLGDPAQLTQVFVNLLANANRYAPDEAVVQLGARALAERFEVWVEDNGPGIPVALSASVFDRFRRASSEGSGMGLGLWIAKSIVERHGGTIVATSGAVGGARFEIFLPREVER